MRIKVCMIRLLFTKKGRAVGDLASEHSEKCFGYLVDHQAKLVTSLDTSMSTEFDCVV